MITFEQAREIIRRAAPAPAVEELPLAETPGRVCAEVVTSPLNIQPFDNSAMDGFALRAAELAGAAPISPVELACVGAIAAGDPPPAAATPAGGCWEIMTGAPMPADCDTVVPVEATARGKNGIRFENGAPLGGNVRPAGQDFITGQKVVTTGQRLSAAHVMVLATLGLARLKVYKKPAVAVISTGSELVREAGESLAPGQIYNSNGPYLVAALETLGAHVTQAHCVEDNPEAFTRLVEEAVAGGAELLVSSGAVSMGRHDFIRPALEAMGAEILYHKVAIRPGKPNLLARLPGGQLYFGLPGNPAATVVGARFFVNTALRAMSGLPEEKPLTALLKNEGHSKQGFRFFLKGHLAINAAGSLEVTALPGQASFMVSPFVAANGWVVAPEAVSTLAPGEEVEVLPFFPESLSC